MEDQELISKYLQGDEEAFQTLVKRYLKLVYNFVFLSVRDPEYAEDITQEVFIKVWSHLKKFDPSKSFKVWVYAIAKNSIFDFLRKKKLVPFSFLEREEEIYEVVDSEPLPNEILDGLNSAKKLDGALGKIDVLYRQVLVLYYQNGFNFREIAEILKTSVNTVKSRHRRALVLLEKVIKKADLG